MFENLFGTKMDFIEWNDYQARIQFLDNFHFQQRTRRQNVRNL